MTFLHLVTWRNNLAPILMFVGIASVFSSQVWADSVQSETLTDQSRSLITDVIGLSGSFRSAFFSKDTSFSGDTGYAVGSLWLTAKPKEVLGTKTYFDVRVQDQNLTRSSNLKWDLREGYLQRSFDDLDFKVGRQITVWGRADKINPTDTWSARDFTLLTTDDEDQRLGVSSLQVVWNQRNFRLIGIWHPEWRAPSYLFPPLPPGVTIQYLNPVSPASQIGVKLDHTGGDVDFSFSYAHTINRTPDLAILSSGPEAVSTGLKFNSIHIIGADAAIVIGNYGLRGEVAYTVTRNDGESNPLAQKDNIFTVVGADRTFVGELNVNVQYLYKHVFHWQGPSEISDPTVRLFATKENLLSNQQATDMSGASLRVNYKAFNETLESEIAMVAWFAPDDFAFIPKISYAFSDHFKGVIGGRIFRGNKDTLFGSLRATSTAFAELRIGF